MQHDEIIWQVINHGHCSFRAKTQQQNFCRNEYNVTGLCNRSSCPLANSRYATIREHDGVLYLYMKTIERAHMPKKLWQRVKLKKNYAQALEQLDKNLEFWPKFLVHKNKQRLTKITQMLIRMRKLATKVQPKLTTMPARKEKQAARKEAKAETAAKLDKAIEGELLARLQKGTYGDIYNFPVKQYEAALAKEEVDEEEEEEEDEEEREEEEEEEEEPEVEFVEGYDIEESDDDIEDNIGWGTMGGDDDEDDEGSESEEDDDEEEGGSSEESEEDEDERPRKGAKRGAAPPAAKAGAKGAAGKKGGKPAPPAKRPRRGGNVEVEYEEERETGRSLH